MTRRIILDCDPGHDDAMALLLARGAQEIELAAITTVAGNHTLALTTLNALRLCTLAGISSVPVAAGCAAPLLRPLVTAPEIHGTTGLEGHAWGEPSVRAVPDHAVDVIIDLVSGSVANQNLAAAAILGRIVNVGRLGGMKGEFNFDLHALKRIDYIGVTFRTRTPDEVRAIVKAARADLWPAIEAGKLSLPIDKTFPLAQAAEALAHMKANAHFGKIVLVV